jgi:hypothetical protein
MHMPLTAAKHRPVMVQLHDIASDQIDFLLGYSEIRDPLRFRFYNVYFNLYTTNNIFTSTDFATRAFRI